MTDIIISGTSGKSNTLSTVYSKSRYNPVGTVKQSVLSEGQFQSKASPDWVMSDGRLLLISSYPDLYSAITTTYGSGTILGQPAFRIPDMRNRYSRMAGTFALGSCLGNSSGINGLSVGGASYSIQRYSYCYLYGWTWNNVATIDAAASNHYHNPTDLGIALQHTAGSRLRWLAYTGSGAYQADTCMATDNITLGAGACVTKGIAVLGSSQTPFNDYTQTASMTYTSATLSSSDPETRPETVVLNWFIKIK